MGFTLVGRMEVSPPGMVVGYTLMGMMGRKTSSEVSAGQKGKKSSTAAVVGSTEMMALVVWIGVPVTKLPRRLAAREILVRYEVRYIVWWLDDNE